MGLSAVGLLRAWVPSGVLASLTLVLAMFGLVFVEGPAQVRAGNLGHAGDAIRIVALDGTDPAQFQYSLFELVESENYSLAYTASMASGVVVVFDRAGTFLGGVATPAAGIGGPGSGPAALLSGPADEQGIAVRDVDGNPVRVVGSFASQTQFDSMSPSVVVSVDTRPLVEGTYLFAMHSQVTPRDVNTLSTTFSSAGVEIVDLQASDSSLQSEIAVVLSPPYGLLSSAFALILVAVLACTLALTAASMASRWHTEAVLGASRRQLRRRIRDHLLRLLRPGMVAGGLLTVVVIAIYWQAMLAPASWRWLVLVIALVTASCVACIVAIAISWREVRRVSRDVPC